MDPWSFVLYTVQGKQRHETRIGPTVCFEQVDIPFWQLQRKADPSLTVSVTRTLPSVQHSERITLDRTAPSTLLSAELTAFYQQHRPWIAGLRGKRLLFSEVLRAYSDGTNQQHTTTHSFLALLQTLHLLGCFEWEAPFRTQSHTLSCKRCGYGSSTPANMERKRALVRAFQSASAGIRQILRGERLVPAGCERCTDADCVYCPGCLQLGKVKSCEPLLSWKLQSELREPDTNPLLQGKSVESRPNTVRCVWQGKLTEAQQHASNRLLRFVQEAHPANREFLLWAVCGAGKTELLFQALTYALRQRQNVLIASPRSDVVRELAPRLEQAFPTVRIVALHAESNQKFAAADLYIATTHQIMRFYDHFDLIIIDEVDAFPYSVDRKLSYAVHQALKTNGRLVYLSATPQDELIQRVKKREVEAVEITKRYHGHPLAVPRITPIGNWRKWMQTRIVSSELSAFLESLIVQKRFAYLFVPHVKDIPLVERYVQETLLPYSSKRVGQNFSFPVVSVHAQHPDRTHIVQRFRSHNIRLLITTSILERGVTIPYCDVAVLGSDDPVFTTAALIQMAGRAGRKMEDPLGSVCFFPQVRTQAQLACVKQIRQWNEAKE